MATSSQRQETILNLLKNQDKVSVNDLQTKLYYSESSIRRDLKAMEKLGLVVLRRGEISLNRGMHFEMPTPSRNAEHKMEKQRIAEYAASLIENGDSVYLDASSTVLELLPFLSDKYGLTIVTNGVYTLQQAFNYTDGTFICLGGILRQRNGSSLTGAMSRANIMATHCDKMFFSARAVDTGFGASDLSEDEADIKKNMLKNSDKAYFLADSSKFHMRSLFQVCALDMVDMIITDAGADCSDTMWRPYSDKIKIV